MNKDEVSLFAVDISKAYLPGIKLENAFLKDANLAEADLHFANLENAELMSADLTGTDLSDANFVGADLMTAKLADARLFFANLSEAILYDANLANIEGWQHIESMEHANIYGVRNAPDEFIGWATEQGAVSIEDEEEWQKLLREKRQEQTKEKQ